MTTHARHDAVVKTEQPKLTFTPPNPQEDGPRQSWQGFHEISSYPRVHCRAFAL